MGDNKMLDDEAMKIVDQPPLTDKCVDDDENKPKAALMLDDEQLESAPIKSIDKESSKTTNKKTSESNSSLNSSQSSFVQLKTAEKQYKETKPISPKLSTSLASKLFGRKSDNPSQKQSDKSTDKKKCSKNAPQITQVIYKRKASLPEIPPVERKAKSTTVSIPPDEESTDDDNNNIYAEISETQLVLEEMRRSLNQHTTERKIIELILQQPATNLQESK